MLPRRTLLAALSAICLLTLSATASAATLEVPGDFPNIQDAVDNADPNDVIAVSKKTNNQNVTVSTPRLTIKGVGKGVTIDADAGGGGDAFNITANRTSIANLLIKHGSGTTCVADRCSFQKVRFAGLNSGDCVQITGENARVTGSRFAACGDNAIEIISGDGPRITGNSIRGIDNTCVNVTANEALIRDNSIRNCEDSEAIDLLGDDATVAGNRTQVTDSEQLNLDGDNLVVTGNRMRNSTSLCLDVDGNGALVRGNRAATCMEGFEVTGQNPRVIGNTVDDTLGDDAAFDIDCITACGEGVLSDNVATNSNNDEEGFDVLIGPGAGTFRVLDNVARNNAEIGFDLSVPDGLVRGNVATGNGFEHEEGFEVSGANARVIENVSAGNGGIGFDFTASTGIEVENNLARGNHGDGYSIQAGAISTVLTANRALDNFGDGIDNSGPNTEVRRNTSRGNQVDCANSGAGTIAVNQNNKCADGSDFAVPGEV